MNNFNCIHLYFGCIWFEITLDTYQSYSLFSAADLHQQNHFLVGGFNPLVFQHESNLYNLPRLRGENQTKSLRKNHLRRRTCRIIWDLPWSTLVTRIPVTSRETYIFPPLQLWSECELSPGSGGGVYNYRWRGWHFDGSKREDWSWAKDIPKNNWNNKTWGVFTKITIML